MFPVKEACSCTILDGRGIAPDLDSYHDNVYEELFPREPRKILDEVFYLMRGMEAEKGRRLVEDAAVDTVRLFNGDYRGYRACSTPYHDLNHTLAVLLATARLLHGAVVEGTVLGTDAVVLGLVCALFHDTGLIQTVEDSEGTGAKYTLGHEERSIRFAKAYLLENDDHGIDIDQSAHVIGCTIVSLDPSEISFRSAQTEIVGKILGSADLIAQMADRVYLEKLLLLYTEFVEGAVSGFDSEFDLLEKTRNFYENVASRRLKDDLGNVQRFMRIHFERRHGIDRDVYRENIEKNIGYLNLIVSKYSSEYRKMLRRAGIVSSIERVNAG